MVINKASGNGEEIKFIWFCSVRPLCNLVPMFWVPAHPSTTIKHHHQSWFCFFSFVKRKLGAGRKLNFFSSFTPARPALPHYHINPHNTSNLGQSSNSSPSKSDILLWREHCSTMEKLRDQIDFSAKTFSMLTFEFLEQICQNWRFSVLGSFCWHCYGYSPHMGPEVLSLNFIL